MHTIFTEDSVLIVDGTCVVVTFPGTKEQYLALKDLTPEAGKIADQAYIVVCGDFAIVKIHTTEVAALNYWHTVMEYMKSEVVNLEVNNGS